MVETQDRRSLNFWDVGKVGAMESERQRGAWTEVLQTYELRAEEEEGEEEAKVLDSVIENR